MLRVFIDNCVEPLPSDFIARTHAYFDCEYVSDWFSDEFVRGIIKEIDDSEVVGTGKSVNIYNEVLGNIPPQNLSTGCKTLILLYKLNIKVDGDRLGDNCFPKLFEIATKKDVAISLGHLPMFNGEFPAYILNSGKTITTTKELTYEYATIVFGQKRS